MIPRLRSPSSLDVAVQLLELGVGLGLRLELGVDLRLRLELGVDLFQSTAQFSESEVDQSYRAHLNSVPIFSGSIASTTRRVVSGNL